MVLVPAGYFVMGGNPFYDREPARRVYLSDFFIDVTEVTNAQFARFAENTGYVTQAEQVGEGQTWRSFARPGREQYPVVLITWADAAAYCENAGQRLPWEEEWEKAARGADGRLWPWGNAWDSRRANTLAEGPGGTTPIGSYPEGASPYRILDLAGNVWEWTASFYSSVPKSTPAFDFDTFTGQRVLRGGSWRTEASGTQATYRKPAPSEYRRDSTGFRCAR